MIERKIESRPAVVEPVCVSGQDLHDPKAWLQTQATTYQLEWLLTHADDGVIWGRMDETGKLLVAPEPPPLRLDTLQQARLFSPAAELLLWRDGDNDFHARLIRDVNETENAMFTEAFDERQMLWGTDAESLGATSFTVVSDGARGLRHVVPLHLQGTFSEAKRPLRLCVRHYLKEDASGFVRVTASRLVELTEETKG